MSMMTRIDSESLEISKASQAKVAETRLTMEKKKYIKRCIINVLCTHSSMSDSTYKFDTKLFTNIYSANVLHVFRFSLRREAKLF